MGRPSLVKTLTLMVYSWSKISCLESEWGSAVTVTLPALDTRIGIPLMISPSLFLTKTVVSPTVTAVTLFDLLSIVTYSDSLTSKV